MEYLDAGDKAMSFWTRFKRPKPEAYDSTEEYEMALCYYEDAEFEAMEVAMEQYYEEKYGG